jgi:hypothetical protein
MRSCVSRQVASYDGAAEDLPSKTFVTSKTTKSAALKSFLEDVEDDQKKAQVKMLDTYAPKTGSKRKFDLEYEKLVRNDDRLSEETGATH